MDKQEFIKKIAGYVRKYAADYGIAVHSPIIAQAILESGWGESKLASAYHNYFGLKCGTKWKGRSVNMKTQEEYSPGTKTTITDNFRVYSNMDEGVKGYFEFIQLPRYQNLKGITDPKKYLQTIKDDGYATSSTYVADVFRCVEAYGLTEYDGKAEGGIAMTEKELRQKPVDYLAQYVGIKEGSAEHKAILAVLNNSGLCTRYKMTVNDPWCATASSAAFIASGLADIFPCVECSCGNMIELAKKAGIWVENDAYVPKTGDAILYDWGDSGKGDCTGWPDHVGLVASVSGNTIRVIEGNMSNTVGYRNLAVNGRYIRGFITPKFSTKATSSGNGSAGTSGKKSVSEIAKEVIAGKWGNGDARKSAIKAAGYDYDAVQAEVNKQLKGSPKATKSVTEVANEVIQGKWGNNPERRKKLEAAGYNYSKVQAEVNRLMR
ncbi:MAG: glucosaminidase domain-containing protein [Lachnospiraceae bacterium]